MGLDMFLTARKSFSDFQFDSAENKKVYRGILTALNKVDLDCKTSPCLFVDFTVAYWRKANAIHCWFVRNVQENKDDCSYYYVSREKLQELVALCQRAIKTQDATLLPPESGFFFGSTAVDERYWGQLQNTIDQIIPLFGAEFKDWHIRYQASW